MVFQDFFSNFFKYFFIFLFTFNIAQKISYIKSTLDSRGIISAFLFCLILSLLYAILSLILKGFSFFIIIFLTLLLSIYFNAFFKMHIHNSIITVSTSLLISLICFTISIFIICMLVELPFFNLHSSSPLLVCPASILELFLIKSLFKIKRFRHGFSFINNLSNKNPFSFLGIVIFISFVFIFSITKNNTVDLYIELFIVCFILISIYSYIWIKRSITLDYRERMRNREVNMLKEELEAEKEKNVKLNEEISELAKINHKYSSRIKASEESVKKLAYMFNKTNNTEFGNELSDITKLITDLSSQYSNEIASKLKYAKKLPSTNVKGVDSILSYMQKESLDNNIDFELKINCSVNHLIEKYISQNRLETLLGDHIKDAIIAINSGNNNLRKIYVIFDIIDNCYQISFYDSGIDFEIDTLINLGLEAITTHKDTGGNGFGFLTTFETLKECKASLIIEEINFKNSNFSKAIHVLFDNNSSYVIKTNRIEDFKNYNISDRIILEEEKNN